ncbi:MAG: hypothetical protein OXH70_07820 [Acidobacteria bacterium]|nr:hypothetical protein [Acidobacteriota bacterium]
MVRITYEMAEPAREPDYATKADVDVLRAEMKAENAAVRAGQAELESRLTERMASLEVRTMRTLYAVAAAMLAGQVAAVLTLVRLLG